jgi:hypothetical protein
MAIGWVLAKRATPEPRARSDQFEAQTPVFNFKAPLNQTMRHL